MKRLTIIASALLLLGLARDGAAQGFVNPFVGVTLTSPSARGGSSKPGFGVAFGKVGRIMGGETEIAYYPEVLDKTANSLAKSRVITFSGGPLIGPTIGGVKPYGAFGVGNLNLNVTSAASLIIPNPTSFSSNYFTFNVGGGVMGFFGSHLGVRGDLRYYRAFGFKFEDVAGEPGAGLGGLALDRFDFWRAAFGLAVKF
jgi:Outer membrane protein beta-barrel domain